jgi:hypothetical protein
LGCPAIPSTLLFGPVTDESSPVYSIDGFVGPTHGSYSPQTATFEASPGEHFSMGGPCYYDCATDTVTSKPVGPVIGRVMSVTTNIGIRDLRMTLQVQVQRDDFNYHHEVFIHSACYNQEHHPGMVSLSTRDCGHPDCVVRHVLET